MDKPVSSWRVRGLLLIMLAPFAVGVFLFEALLENLITSNLEKARDTLPTYARRMEEGEKPSSVLAAAISREIGEGLMVGVSEESVREFVTNLKKALGFPGRFYFYGKSGNLIYPGGDVPDRAEREAFYQAVEHLHSRRKITAESMKRDQVAKKFCRENFGYATFLEFEWARRFNWECHNPPEPPKFVAFIKQREDIEKEDGYHLCLHIEVFTKDIPDSMKTEGCLAQIPEDLPFAAIVASQTILQSKSAAGWAPPSDFIQGEATDEVTVRSGYFLYKRILDVQTGRTLVLATPFPFPASIPFPLRLLLESALLAFLWGRGKKFSEILLGDRGLRIDLGKQIFLSFLFASLVPLLSLGFLGSARLTEIHDLQKAHWKNRMLQFLTTLDRKFNNWTVALQLACRDFSRFLSQHPETALEKEILPSDLLNAHSIFFADARTDALPAKLFSSMTHERTSEFSRNKDHMKKMLSDFLMQFLTDRGQGRSSSQTGKPLPPFTIQDILGENNPVLLMIKTMNRMTFTEFGQTKYVSYCRLLETVKGKILGFALLIFEITSETRVFLSRTAESLKQIDTPFTLLHVHPEFPTGEFKDFGLINFTRVVKGTIETQKPEHFSLLGPQGREFFATTFFPRYLMGRFPICAVSTDHILKEKTNLILTIVLFFCLGLGTILLVSRILRRRIIDPVKLLQQGARRITSGVYSHRLAVETTDELGSLSASFNEMAAGLQERERMRRFVSGSVISDIRASGFDSEESNRGKRIQAAVLFSDIRDFTTLSESHSPDEVVKMLNEYFSEMDTLIKREGGEIQKLIGDAILAVFPTVPEAPHPAVRACKAGYSMRRALKEFNRKRSERHLFTIESGIGIHFDELVAGRIGASGGRLDFTVMGPALGLTQTLESLSKRGSHSRVILSSQAHLQSSAHFSCARLESGECEAWEIIEPR